jgi:hypothetical protein
MGPTERSFEQFRDDIVARVRRMHAVLEHPDADWPGVLFLQTATGVDLVLFRLAGISEDEKRALATVELPGVVGERGATRCCLLLPSIREDVEPPVECLALLFVDGERVETVIADVIRSRTRPPKLIRWRSATRGAAGLFVDSLRDVLAAGA